MLQVVSMRTDDDEPLHFEPLATAMARIVDRLRFLEMIEERLTEDRQREHCDRRENNSEDADDKQTGKNCDGRHRERVDCKLRHVSPPM